MENPPCPGPRNSPSVMGPHGSCGFARPQEQAVARMSRPPRPPSPLPPRFSVGPPDRGRYKPRAVPRPQRFRAHPAHARLPNPPTAASRPCHWLAFILGSGSFLVLSVVTGQSVFRIPPTPTPSPCDWVGHHLHPVGSQPDDWAPPAGFLPRDWACLIDDSPSLGLGHRNLIGRRA